MLRRWLNRPLTNNPFQTALIYGIVALALNNSINSFWVTEQNPDGLTGFFGYLLMFTSIAIGIWMSNRENDWLRDIRKAEAEAQGRR